jgi:membrane protein DedA with SNARE-associated domain
MNDLLSALGDLPPGLLLLTLGLGAALENVVPPLPADTVVLLGAFLAARGIASPWAVFLVTWGGNVASALLVYWVARRRGLAFFRRGWGRWLLSRRQIAWLRRFHSRWGAPAIFLSRFLPGVRAVVPVFAGVARQSPLSVFIPLSVASGIWYGALVMAGTLAGRNLDAILATLAGVNRTLLLVALVLAGVAGFAWFRSRKPGRRRRGRADKDA